MTRIAICGLGNIGAVHLKNLSSLRGCAISGVFDTRAERLTLFRENGVRIFKSFQQLLEDPDTDAVVIATPSSSHRSLTVEALSHGKHVFVEKPVAATLEDARVITVAAASSGKKVQVGFCERFNPQFIEAKSAVRGGVLGSVRAIYSSRTAPLSLGDPTWDLGIFDTAVHNIDLILWLMERKPIKVRVQGVKLYSVPPAIHSAITTLTFEDGSLATDHITWLQDDHHPLHQCARARMLLLGEKGSFEIDLSQRPSSVLTAEKFNVVDTVILGGPDYYGCLKLQFEAFLRSVESNSPVLATPEEALLAEEVAIAATESLRSGREVELT